MDTLHESGILENLPIRDDSTLDLTGLARRALESVLNQVMGAQADELLGDGNRRNGYRERRLVESESAPDPLTHRVPFRHDVRSGVDSPRSYRSSPPSRRWSGSWARCSSTSTRSGWT